MNLSLGFIETQGLIATIEAADVMAKAAAVKLLQTRQIGTGLVTIIIEGELGAVQAAVDAARIAVARIGEPLIASWVIANPFDDTSGLITNFLNKKTPKIPPASASQPVAPTVNPENSAQKTKSNPKVSRESETSGDHQTTIPVAVKPEQAPSAERKKNVAKEWLTLPELLTRQPQGLTLEAISAALGQEAAEVRKSLKKLMDAGLVEKVRNLFFLVKKEDK